MDQPYEELRGRVVIVTGAAQGIGAATARKLGAVGMKVIVNDIEARLGFEVAESIVAGNGAAQFIAADMERHSEIERLVHETVELYGRADCVVHCAYWSVAKDVVALSEVEWDKGMAIMLKAAYLLGKHTFPHMVAVGGGGMVNISSVHGFGAVPHYPVYGAAKAGLLNLTRQMAVDGGPHRIRVNAICPGYIQTRPLPGNAPNPEDMRIYPLRRPGQPEEIANAVLFLLSAQASFITGHALVVDGGLTAMLQDGSTAGWSDGKSAFGAQY